MNATRGKKVGRGRALARPIRAEFVGEAHVDPRRPDGMHSRAKRSAVRAASICTNSITFHTTRSVGERAVLNEI